MKKWKIGAIVGGIWGLISIIQRLTINPHGATGYSLLEKILFFPYWFQMTVLYNTIFGLLAYVPPLFVLFIVFEGVLIGASVGYIYEKWKGSMSLQRCFE